jgi:hypothetical protein
VHQSLTKKNKNMKKLAQQLNNIKKDYIKEHFTLFAYFATKKMKKILYIIVG